MWFTETPWPPICILAVVAAVFAAGLISTQRTMYLIGIVVPAMLGVVVYFVEQRIVTEGERVEIAIYGVADAFQRRDVPGTVNYFSQNAILPRQEVPSSLQLFGQNFSLRAAVAGAIAFVEVRDDLHITDVSVETSNHDTRATSHFRANGTFLVGNYGDVGSKPTQWEFHWQKEAGEWRIIRVERLDPITSEPMGVFDASVRAQ